MTIEEIKAKLPEADVYALSPDFKYLVVCEHMYIDSEEAMDVLKMLEHLGVKSVAVFVNDKRGFKLLEIKP